MQVKRMRFTTVESQNSQVNDKNSFDYWVLNYMNLKLKNK